MRFAISDYQNELHWFMNHQINILKRPLAQTISIEIIKAGFVVNINFLS